MQFVIGLLMSLLLQVANADMNPIHNRTDDQIKKLSTGVCSLGQKNGTSCCTGFRISKNLVMTNFHCLSCIHQVYEELVKETPFLMEPEAYLYTLSKGGPEVFNKIKQKIKENRNLNINLDLFFLPQNEKEIMSLLNLYPELYYKINFKNEVNITDENVKDAAINIKKIVSLNKDKDFVIIRTDEIPQEHNILKLLETHTLINEELLIIGHPAKSSYPHKKVYDVSKNCKITNTHFTNTYGNRGESFVHHCETSYGNSGSPLIQRSSGDVIGIHWGSANNVGSFGIEMKRITNFLNIYYKDIYEEIIAD